jgi:murein DD-endopeptidase MepM/ murein hydrolase activator NlpD
VDGPEPDKPEGAESAPSSPAEDPPEAPTQGTEAVETPQAASIEPARSFSTLSAPDATRGSRIARLSKRVRMALAFVAGGAIAAAIGVPLGIGRAPDAPRPATAAAMAGAIAGASAVVVDSGAEVTSPESSEPAPARNPVWRVTRLADDPSITMIDGVIARRPLLAALSSAGIARTEAQRVARSLADVRDVERFGAKDSFTVARDKASGRVVAYEVATSLTDVWQAREEALSDGTTKLVPRKLDLPSERVRVRKALVVGNDLRASLADAGLTPIDDVLAMLDDALEGHAEPSDIRPGARLRLVATQERVDGVFARWASLDAVEYFPASNAPPVRVYNAGAEDERASRDHRGWYDAKGQQPYRGGWHLPVPLTRIASRFNPRRMHPVLHVLMPHNGVDLAAPSGAPVYATATGNVISVGNAGPCGNMVEISHPGNITSVYCHLSRFAAGLRPGQHVEARQLIGYVGQTGRVTGPHLHFGIKKNGVFVDPMTLRLDSVRVVPRSRREEFDRLRSVLDSELDSIPLPAVEGAATSPPPDNQDTIFEEP